MAKKPVRSEAEELAALCARAHATLARAGRSLHDDVGPQLAGAGILLSLARTDFPKAAPALQEVLTALDEAMEHVRALSQELNGSPVDRVGLRHALLRISEQDSRVEVNYSTTAILSREAASAVYDAAVAAIRAAVNAGAERIRVHATGAKNIQVRVADNGQVVGRLRALSVTARLAQAAGVVITVTTIKSTIVSIRYAIRSTAGR